MKKILLLTGICILSACGGGGGSTPISGGATAGKPAEGRPNINEDSFPRETGISNSKVTSMMSQIFIPKGNVGDGYDMYTLQDVKFISSDDTPTDDDYITFDINDKTGVIENLIIRDDADKIAMTRKLEGNTFSTAGYRYQISDWWSDVFLSEIKDKGKLRTELQKQMKNDGLSAKKQVELLSHFDNQRGFWSPTEIVSQIDLFGKDIGKHGLRHADFGYNIVTVGNSNNKDYSVIAGGYIPLNIPANQINNQKLKFYGKAVGYINHKDTNGKPSEISTDKGTTVLVFDNGKETLTMPFNEYYTVIVEKEGDNSNIKFTDWNGADSKYKFTNKTATSDDAWIMYYGTNGKPFEAVGTVEHSENSTYRPSFEAGFGVQAEQ